MCKCFGYKLVVIGALLVVNDQSWVWSSISAWLLIGLIFIALGALKIAWPCGCPVHGKTSMGAKPSKKKK